MSRPFECSIRACCRLPPSVKVALAGRKDRLACRVEFYGCRVQRDLVPSENGIINRYHLSSGGRVPSTAQEQAACLWPPFNQVLCRHVEEFMQPRPNRIAVWVYADCGA